MKTFIIATLLVVGVSLRPQIVPSGNEAQFGNANATMVAQTQTTLQPLDKTELNAVIGEGFSCFGEIDKNGTSVYYTCCIGFWIFKICGSVYLGEVPAPLTR